MRYLLATYGTFRRGCTLNYYLNYMRIRGNSEDILLPGLKVVVLGDAPGAVITRDNDDVAIVELIEADMPGADFEDMLKVLDIVEGVYADLYERSSIDTPKGKAVIYTYASELPEWAVQIKDWKDWVKKPEREKQQAFSDAGWLITV